MAANQVPMTTADSQGEWHVVGRRRRPRTDHGTPIDAHDKIRPYVPFSSRATYAQVVASSQPRYPTSSNASTKSSTPPSSRATTPPSSPPAPTYFSPPQSPNTRLRFPPLPAYSEWRDRCFKCCQLGHTAAHCTKDRKCGRCWGDGHTFSKCPSSKLSPAARPFYPSPTYAPSVTPHHYEPGFSDLMGQPSPAVTIPLAGSTAKHVCYIERDEAFNREVERLSHAVVLSCHDRSSQLTVLQVIEMAVGTGLLREEELRVAELSGDRLLLHLPKGLAIETFVRAVPRSIWDRGYTFQQWSLLDEAEVTMPRFKVLLDLVGLPLMLWREMAVIRAISGFGLFLGSVPPARKSDRTAWRVAVAMDDINRIPQSIAYIIGGLEYPVKVVPVNWSRGAIYTREDFPAQPIKYSRPPPPPEVHGLQGTRNRDGPNSSDEEEPVACSRRVLLELCQELPVEDIPPEIVSLLSGRRGSNQIPMEAMRELHAAMDVYVPYHPPVSSCRNNGPGQDCGFRPGTSEGARDCSLPIPAPHPNGSPAKYS
ncbi:hypothetical protein FCM35_KLT13101 [Carex littledalei]|uniref:CCHC-type domain-containing protein n=1 Tax=Carex littledalei TaxID=544730 RepID=A0A833V467_9POAL|nr:hypothetical protein FCM35_KLT13101 [Carex littledalei]